MVETALNKLRSIRRNTDTLYEAYKSMSNGNIVDPIKPNYDMKSSSQLYTSGWTHQNAMSTTYDFGTRAEFEINQIQGLVGEMGIEVDLPDQYDPGTGSEDIQYAPLPALALIDAVDVFYGNENVHTFYPKELFQLINLTNLPEDRRQYLMDMLGGYCVSGGNQYVTRPGKVTIPLPIEGSSLELGKHLWNEYTPLPANRISGKFKIRVRLTTAARFSNAGSSAKPINMKLAYKEYMTKQDEGMPAMIGPQQNVFSPSFIPTRGYVSYEKFGVGFSNSIPTNIDINTIRLQGELLTLLLHITDVNKDNDTQRKYFDFEEIEYLVVKMGNSEIYHVEDSREFKTQSLRHYRMDTRCIGSTAPADEQFRSGTRAVQIPIAEHDYRYRDSVGQGANPWTTNISIVVKTKNTFTGNIQVTALYRSILYISGTGAARLTYIPQDRGQAAPAA